MTAFQRFILALPEARERQILTLRIWHSIIVFKLIWIFNDYFSEVHFSSSWSSGKANIDLENMTVHHSSYVKRWILNDYFSEVHFSSSWSSGKANIDFENLIVHHSSFIKIWILNDCFSEVHFSSSWSSGKANIDLENLTVHTFVFSSRYEYSMTAFQRFILALPEARERLILTSRIWQSSIRLSSRYEYSMTAFQRFILALPEAR